MSKKSPSIEIFSYETQKKLPMSLYLSRIRAGFPSPADDYLDKKLDLNDHLIKNPAATFFVKVTGNSMINAGIKTGDLLIVDRSLEPKDKKIIVAVINGEFTVKRILKKGEKLFLAPENESFPPIEIKEEMDFEIWETVLFVVHAM